MDQTHRLTLIQINDVHAYLEQHPEMFWEKGHVVYRPAGGYARISGLVNQIRSENPHGTLFLDNGDTLHGTYPAIQTKGQALIPILNRLGLDAMTAHWEFAYGPQVFKQRASELNYPVLALNVKREDSHDLFFPAYQVKETGGLRVGIAGIASNIVDKTMPPSFSQGLEFSLGKADLPDVVDLLRSKEKADLVVVLSHLGFPQDMQLAEEVRGIDVILSGHTHNRIYEPARQGLTIIIQSGSQGSFLGKLVLTVESGRVTDYEHQLLEVDPSIAPDPEIEDLVKETLQPFREELGEIVGETRVPLDRGMNLEATMDNLLLAAIQANVGAQVAFSNGWRYGAPIVPGPVTMNDLYNMIPMNPPISTVELTGSELLEMIEENLEHTFSRDPYQQMGGYVKRSLGIRVYFKVENPKGHRIHKMFVGEEAVKPDKAYQVAFVTEQGVPQKFGRNRQQHPVHAVEALRKYLHVHRPVEIGLNYSFVPI